VRDLKTSAGLRLAQSEKHLLGVFGFELGTINTPGQNSTAFSKPEGGTREARPKDSRRIPPMNSEFLVRWRALIFRQGGGSKSEAILTAFALPEIQKEFLSL